jgi:hypothetical protein
VKAHTFEGMRNSSGATRTAIVGVAVAVLFSACQVPQPPRHLVGPIAVPDDCPGLLDDLARIERMELPPPTVRVSDVPARTAVDVWGRRALADIDLPDLAEFLGSFHGDHPVVAEGRLPSTGIEVEVRSDRNVVRVDLQALDHLVLLLFSAHYPDLRFSALMSCYEERVLVERELEGRHLRMYVPSDPTACFQGGVLHPRGDGGCDAVGIAVPETTLDWGVLRLRWPSTIVISPGHHPSSLHTPEEQAALTMVHELVHFLDSELGAAPHPSVLGEYEQRAYYAEGVVRRATIHGGAELPTPFTWPPHIPETAEDPRR